MRVNYYQPAHDRTRGKTAGARVTTIKTIQAKGSENALAKKKSGGLGLYAITATPLSRPPTNPAAEAINDLAKLIMNAEANGTVKSDLEKRIKAIQAIAALILTAKTDEVEPSTALDPKIANGKTKPSGQGATNQLRSRPAEDNDLEELTFHDLHLDVARHRITVENNPVNLTIKEFKLLTLLARRRGRVQSRERLLEDVWEYNCALDTRTVDTHIRRLRQKLGPARDYIETVNGIGYRFREN
jgi:DNA-binding response OmpR family regulator